MSTASVSFNTATTAGDLVIVGLYLGPSSSIASVTDSQANGYTQIGSALSSSTNTQSSALFYAKNIKGGPDTVTVTLSAVPQYPGLAIYIFEYKGIDTISPLDGNAQARGSSSSVSSGNLTTTVSGDLLFGFCVSDSSCSQGSGFTARSTYESNLGEDKTLSSPGTTSATATANAPWTMQAAAFKPASAGSTPPSVPTGLTWTPVSMGQINLSWTASTDPDSPVAGYNVYRNNIQVGTAPGTSFSDTGLAANTTYSYTVSAYDAAGNVSSQSSPVSATTLADTTAPSVPTGLAANPVSTSQINLSWTASTDPDSPVAGYIIYRNSSQDGTSTGTSFADTGLAANTTYSYTVSAYDAAGNVSSPSSPVSATTLADTTAPSVPTGLTATPISPTQINLSWIASTDPDSPVAGYNIFRNSSKIGSSTTTSYPDTGLTPSTTYSYTVTAYDAAVNESAQSTGGSATTQAAVLAQIRQEYAMGYVENTADDSEDFIQLDTGALDGSVSYYFEVTQLNPSGSTVTLRRKGTSIDDARITLDGVKNHVQRSNAFTPPVGATDYVFHDSAIDLGDYMVRIVALQSNFSKTQTQIELNTDGDSTYPYSSTSFGIAFPHPAYWKYAAANWDGTKTFSWEIVWKSSSSSATATAQLQASADGSSWSAVGSDVTTTSTTATRTRTTFIPTDGNFYRIVVHASGGGTSVTAFAYRIIVDQTNSPTKLEANYVLAASRWGVSSFNDAATKWIRADWSGTTNTYKHRNVTVNARTTDVIRLYGITDGANLTGSTNTADGTIMVTSGAVTMPTTDQDISYNYTTSTNSTFVDSRILVLVSVAPPDTAPPTAPTNLTATGSVATATLSWSAATDNVAVVLYNIYRSTTSGFVPTAGNKIGQATSTAYSDHVAAGTYYYLVTAQDGAGNISATSNEAIANVAADTIPPLAPTNLVATPISYFQIDLTWTASTDDVGVAGYYVFRNALQIATSTATSYSDTGLTASTTYTYTVSAFDASGNISPASQAANGTTFAASSLPPGLIAAYTFSEGAGTTTADDSGNGKTGTLVNSPVWSAGKYGNALSYNGVNSYVSIPNTFDIAALPFTIAAWVNPTNYNNYRKIFSKRDNWSINAMRVDLALNTNNGHVMLERPNSVVEFSYSPPLNTWTHVAVVARTTGTDLYVNGNLTQTRGAFSLGTSATAQVRIGLAGDGQDPFLGRIDNLRIYSRALTPSEVQTDMNTPAR